MLKSLAKNQYIKIPNKSFNCHFYFHFQDFLWSIINNFLFLFPIQIFFLVIKVVTQVAIKSN